jgi:NFU1 iron-sulfur cluster scaffold homolog, mitochondrial
MTNQEFCAQDVKVRVQITPNPKALKFITNKTIKAEGKATFNSPQESEKHLLFYDLFLLDGVRQVYAFQNTLTISHDGTVDLEEFKKEVTAIIETRLPVHNSNFLTPQEEDIKKPKDRSNLSEDLQEIESIFDRTIRPGLQADGGDIDVLSYENNILKIAYQGACGSCPSSMMGTLHAIESILKNEFNPDIRVYPE